mmetsp:Transcript_14540/g.46679  ORF Transcript_14540/g.46679 Transcript_14540/m.46679 type:complete len:259 (+) Transcript_14540:330-1106(+)
MRMGGRGREHRERRYKARTTWIHLAVEKAQHRIKTRPNRAAMTRAEGQPAPAARPLESAPRRPRHPWPARAQRSRRARLCSQRRRLPTLGRAAAARGARRWKRVRTAACWVAARSRPQPAPPPAGRDAPCRRRGWTPWRQAGAAPSPRGAVQRRSRKTKRAANTDATRGRTTLAAGRLSSPPRRRPAARPDATPRAGGARPCARGCRSAARRTSPWSGARAPAPRWPPRAHRTPSRARCRASPSSHRPRRPERRRPPP